MCYTIKIDHTREEIEKRFGARLSDAENYTHGNRISAFSLPHLPVIASEDPEEIKIMNWGLIPFWVKDIDAASQIRTKTFNAKTETLLEKPSYRHSYHQKRCLVPVSGFYEWQTHGKQKTPFYIALHDQNIFALAGLYDYWTNPSTGEIVSTFTIITTRANAMMEEIHNLKKRMPVILSPGRERLWLDTRIDGYAAGIFDPYPQELMVAEKALFQ